MQRRAFFVIGLLVLAAIVVLLAERASSSAPRETTVAEGSPQSLPFKSAPPRPAPSAPAPAPARAPAAAPTVQRPDAGDAQLAGQLVAMGQSLALADAVAQNAANAAKYVDKFCAQNARLPALPAAGTNADAAAFMAPRMDYEKPLDEPPGSLHLPDELRARLRGAGWLDKVTDADLQRDFSWLTQLQQFDHWSYLGAGRLRDYVISDAPHASIPNYSSLLVWAKLRYALAVRRGDLPTGMTEVRHLADLMRSQGVLIAEACAIFLYGLEAQVHAPGAMDTDELARRKDLAFAAIDFADPGVDPSVVRKAMECAKAPCTAIAEAVAMNRSLSSAAGTDNLGVLNDLAAARGCDAELLGRLNASREYPTAQALGELAVDLPQAIPKRLGSP
jgi:hypothetical protein